MADNPQSVRFEQKTGNASGVYSMRVDGNYRVAFTKNADGNFVPAFVGNHNDYDRFLAQKPNKLTPSALLGDDNAKIRTIDLDVPDNLRQQSVMRNRTSFSIGDIKLRGVTGMVIGAGTAVFLEGGVKEAAAATTPGAVGLELYEGDIQGATEALVVGGAGDVGCIAGGAVGAKYGAAGGAALGSGAAGVGAGPGFLIGGAGGAIGGCIVGSIAASATAQAAWNWAFGDDEAQIEVQDLSDTLDELKAMNIEDVPDTISDDMPQDLRNLVMYKQGVAESLETLNTAAEVLANDPDNDVARENFIAAAEQFNQAADAYSYSHTSMDDPAAVEEYLDNTTTVMMQTPDNQPAPADPAVGAPMRP